MFEAVSSKHLTLPLPLFRLPVSLPLPHTLRPLHVLLPAPPVMPPYVAYNSTILGMCGFFSSSELRAAEPSALPTGEGGAQQGAAEAVRVGISSVEEAQTVRAAALKAVT